MDKESLGLGTRYRTVSTDSTCLCHLKPIPKTSTQGEVILPSISSLPFLRNKPSKQKSGVVCWLRVIVKRIAPRLTT